MASIHETKPITEKTLPGTDVPDVREAPVQSLKERRWMSAVAVTTAVLATLASLASMFSGDHLNKAMNDKIEMSDQFSFYQAKSIKASLLENKLGLLSSLDKPVSGDDQAQLARYNSEKDTIKTDADKAQASSSMHLHRHELFGRAATAFQVAIALCAVALLTRKNPFWLLALVLLIVGSVFFTMGFLPQG